MPADCAMAQACATARAAASAFSRSAVPFAARHGRRRAARSRTATQACRAAVKRRRSASPGLPRRQTPVVVSRRTVRRSPVMERPRRCADKVHAEWSAGQWLLGPALTRRAWKSVCRTPARHALRRLDRKAKHASRLVPVKLWIRAATASATSFHVHRTQISWALPKPSCDVHNARPDRCSTTAVPGVESAVDVGST